MAELEIAVKLEMSAQFTVNEIELRALDALAGYGEDAFIKHFYDHLGKAYMRDHEAGLRTFLGTIRKVTGPALHSMEAAKKALNNNN